ncbi:MAG TPA: hypothetical protein VES02_16810 [Dermatophilaceae bacterium]|nr:hypothetical protein [Dermatophilaceae bacterium]
MDDDLLTVAAQASPNLNAESPTDAEPAARIAGLAEIDKDAVLLRVVQSDVHVGAELRRRLTPTRPDPPILDRPAGPTERRRWLATAAATVEERVDAVVGHEHRKAYARVASLAVAHAEALAVAGRARSRRRTTHTLGSHRPTTRPNDSRP